MLFRSNAASATSATNATNATNATYATSPASGGSFITSSNIGSQSVNYATSAGSASSASSATNATNATNASYASTQATSDNSTLIATTAFVKNAGLGWGQSYTDVTSSRANGSTYTNNTGKPIYVVVAGVGTPANFLVDGVVVASTGLNSNVPIAVFYMIVPSGSTYGVTSMTISKWTELR